MSDVLYHARPTPSQQAAIAHQARFRANIEAAALRHKIIPIQCAEPEAVPVLVIKWIDPAECFGPIVARQPREVTQPTVDEIIKATARHFKISRIELLADRRTMDVVFPRHIGMYVAKKLTSRSLPHIGRRFGGRDHTTVLNANRKMALRVLNGELAVISAVNAISQSLNGAI